MQMCFYLLFLLHISAACRMEGNRDTKVITAYTGGSVLLPCSCIDLHIKPHTLTWRKRINLNEWEQISPESDQYKDQFQMVNDHSSGNLSLLISHLTEQDGGDYVCITESESRYLQLIVEGCKLNNERVYVTGYVGDSVLLPCSCSELQTKPQTFTWKFYKEPDYKEIFPKDQTNLYTHRVQIFNDPPGNLSLLISHLTVEDEEYYRCEISSDNIKDIYLTVRETFKRPLTFTQVTTTASPNSSTPESRPFIPFAMVTVIFLHIIVAVVYCKTRKKGLDRVHYSRGDGGESVTLQ